MATKICFSCDQPAATESVNPDYCGYDLCETCAAAADTFDPIQPLTTSSYYRIHSDKLGEAIADVRRGRPQMSAEEITAFVLADWPESREHQVWLNSATVGEIVEWVIAGT